MNVGIIGKSARGHYAAAQLLSKTAHDLYFYDPDARIPNNFGEGAVNVCATAAEICNVCETVLLALDCPNLLISLCNGLLEFVHDGQIFIDLGDAGPALSHKTANTMRRLGASYLDCGVFSRADAFESKAEYKSEKPPFLFFVGGNGEAFLEAQPLLRCIAPDCKYMGPSGRGQAARLFCISLTAGIQSEIARSVSLAQKFGIEKKYFLDAIDGLEEIADPLAELHGDLPYFSLADLLEDTNIVREMERRALQDEKR